MNNVTGGVLLALTGLFLSWITYQKYTLFWDSINTRLLRTLVGDTATLILLYIVSILLVVVGGALAVKTNTNYDYLPIPTRLNNYPGNIFMADRISRLTLIWRRVHNVRLD